MKCDEPLFDDGQKYSVYSCRLDLGHPGAHEDARRRKYPRPLALGLDDSVNDLITSGHNVRRDLWDLDERTFPVMVEVTQRYVVWVDAESEDAALAYWADDPSDLSLDKHTALDGDMEIQRLDHHTAVDAFRDRHHGMKIGPQLRCPDCGKDSFRREWFHDPYRKCHGPIVWREQPNHPLPRYRHLRDYQATPVHAEAVRAS